VILASGCFDGLHAGHVRYLQRAKALDPSQGLRVAIAPDAYIRTVKGRTPYWSQMDRAQTVFALGCVDDVILQDCLSVAPVILETKPRIFVKGPDWRGQLPADVLHACHEVDCQIVFTPTPGRHVREAIR
jgi:cytidyltransferase-like protein